MSATGKQHAVVLGGSIAGLLAARMLADHFERVTIVEKERLAYDGEVRHAAPQGAHAHGMLAKGLQIIDDLFPGFSADLASRGATLVGANDVGIYVAGWRLPHANPLKVLVATRPFIEWGLARRVRALPRIDIVEDTEATGLIGDARRATGVRLAERTLKADLIVDARGRRSNLADWMKALGCEPPPHETSPLASVYCSYLLEPKPGAQRPRTLQVAKIEDKLGAIIFPAERNRVLLSLGANANIRTPQTHEEMLAFLRDKLPVPDAYNAIKDLVPITPPAHSRFTASVRRNFDALARLPEGVVAIGDAVASFNPIFGQGMTVAALEAEALGKCLAADNPSTDGFAKRYYDAIKPIVDAAWGFPDLEAKRDNPQAQPLGTRFLLWYTERLQHTASRSTRVSQTIAEVQNMLSPPAMLFRPDIFARVLFG
jgi:2-polyprenyl-6-methoxyphenol hydroxylase-like FAD-dependent oxidoreductase